MEQTNTGNLNVVPPKKKGSPAFWVALILGILLFVSFCLNVILFFSLIFGTASLSAGLGGSQDYDERFVDGDEDSRNKVLKISITGILLNEESSGGFFGVPSEPIVDAVLNRLNTAAKDDKVKALILEINSPGGGITESDRIYRGILEFKKKRPDVPVVVLMQNVAASGGYYIAAPADYIMAHKTTITGSIGVIAQFLNVEQLFQKIGVDIHTIKSDELKDIGSPYRPMTEKEQVLFQKIIDEMYEQFINVVTEGRKGKLNRTETKTLATGMVYTGRQALELKLIDELGYWADAVNKTKELAQLSDARVVEYLRKPVGLFELLAASRSAPAPQFKFPGYRDLLEGKVPKFMYLWITE